jgi:hypothetical protein
MKRPAAPSDFSVEVKHVGTLIFGRRTRRDNIRIGAEYHRLTEGTSPEQTSFGIECEAYATVSALLVDGPPEFVSLLDLDVESSMDTEERLPVISAYYALLEKELLFRKGSGEGGGQAHGPQHGVSVQTAVQPSSD